MSLSLLSFLHATLLGEYVLDTMWKTGTQSQTISDSPEKMKMNKQKQTRQAVDRPRNQPGFSTLHYFWAVSSQIQHSVEEG